MFDYRFVYLKQERNNRLRDTFKRKDEKIGVAVDPSKRRSQIEKTMRGRKLRTLFAIPIFSAIKHETILHRKFKKYKVIKGKNVDGRNEFFNLDFFQRTWVRLYLVGVFLWQWFRIVLLIVILIQLYLK